MRFYIPVTSKLTERTSNIHFKPYWLNHPYPRHKPLEPSGCVSIPSICRLANFPIQGKTSASSRGETRTARCERKWTRFKLPVFRQLFQDLMTKNKQRNWRRLLAGCLVAVVVLGLVIAAAILLTGSPDFTGTGTPAAPGISLEEWLAGSLSPKSFNGTWISGKYLIFLSRAEGRGRIAGQGRI